MSFRGGDVHGCCRRARYENCRSRRHSVLGYFRDSSFHQYSLAVDMRVGLLVERGSFLSIFNSYNWYWLVAWAATVFATSLLAVVVPHIVQRRHHKPLRLPNELLARKQPGFCCFYATILVSVDFLPGQRTLK